MSNSRLAIIFIIISLVFFVFFAVGFIYSTAQAIECTCFSECFVSYGFAVTSLFLAIACVLFVFICVLEAISED